MGTALDSDYRTTIEAFHAFTDDRPLREKWELIDGEMILNPAPTNRRQLIIKNVLFELEAIRRRTGATWQPIPGIGARHPEDQHSEPVPDVMIIPEMAEVANWTFDVLVVFEVLSPDSVRRDMVRKRGFYPRIASLTHYVVLPQDQRRATVFARNAGFSPHPLTEADATIEIEPLGIALRLADLYRDVATD